jgi:hypothetical protein
MKNILGPILATLLVGPSLMAQAPHIATPKMALELKFLGIPPGSNPLEKWEVGYQTASPRGHLMEFVPKGQAIESWQEMVAQQIVFIPEGPTLKEYIDGFKDGVKNSDPSATASITPISEDAAILSYTSLKHNEASARLFLRGPDGIYMTAYHVRPNDPAYSPEKIQAWIELLSTVKLRPNPEILP